jgi:peptide/nickel transport system substrate-binding protein
MAFERWDKYYLAGKPYADKLVISPMGEAAARDVAFRNKEVDVSILGSTQYVAYQGRRQPVEGHPRGRRGLHPQYGHEPDLQALLRQARAPGDQPRHRCELIISASSSDKAYRAIELAAVVLAGLRQGRQALPLRSLRRRSKLLAEAGYPDRLRIRMDRKPE